MYRGYQVSHYIPQIISIFRIQRIEYQYYVIKIILSYTINVLQSHYESF